MPYRVFTVLPSTSGRRSRCTPSRETSDPWYSLRRATLSSSSMKTMAFSSVSRSARALSSSSSTSFAASSSARSRIASFTGTDRVRARPDPRFWNSPWSWLVISSMPGGAMISTPIWGVFTSISTSRSSSFPSRSIARNFSRVSEPDEAPSLRSPGSRTSRRRSSADASARCRTFSVARPRAIEIATSTRSRMMDSTSRPT